MMKRMFFLLVLALPAALFSQTYKISGKVANTQLEPLALASVEVRGSKIGTVTKEDGTYELRLEEGQYEIIVSMIGYQPRVVSVVLNKNIEQHFILQDDEGKDLGEVVIRTKLRDRAEEIMRKVISKKDSLTAAAGSYSCNVYIKATQQDTFLTKGNKPPAATLKAPDQNAGLATMAMA